MSDKLNVIYSWLLCNERNAVRSDKLKRSDIENTWDDCFDVPGIGEYLVLTDDEANQMFREQCDQYVDECLEMEIPENMRVYFDYDKFADDCLMSDGRGHVISGYDGIEHEFKYNGEWFYIYRTN